LLKGRGPRSGEGILFQKNPSAFAESGESTSLLQERLMAFYPLYHPVCIFQSKKVLKIAFNYVIISFVVNIYNALTGRVGFIFPKREEKPLG